MSDKEFKWLCHDLDNAVQGLHWGLAPHKYESMKSNRESLEYLKFWAGRVSQAAGDLINTLKQDGLDG